MINKYLAGLPLAALPFIVNEYIGDKYNSKGLFGGLVMPGTGIAGLSSLGTLGMMSLLPTTIGLGKGALLASPLLLSVPLINRFNERRKWNP